MMAKAGKRRFLRAAPGGVVAMLLLMSQPWVALAEPGAKAPASSPEAPALRVAIYEGEGAGASRSQLIDSLKGLPRVELESLDAESIREGKLSRFQVLIHPGGSGSRQGKALGENGRKAVRDFVATGGGYVGFCAGAYLATNDYDWSLDLIDAKVVDRKHWARGKGEVQVALSPEGRALLETEGEEISIYYAQGPLLGRPEWDDPDTPDYESLGIYRTEIAKNGAPSGIMARTTAIARARFGKGRVFCFSPHPELTEGLEPFVYRAVRWAAEAEPAKTSKKENRDD